MAPTILFPENAAYSCGLCMKCCRGEWLIAISGEEAEALRKLYPEIEPTSGEDVLFGKKVFLMARTSDNACVYLTERGCRVHAEHGFEVKPAVCKKFPFFARTREGTTYVHLSRMCPAAYKEEGAAGEELERSFIASCGSESAAEETASIAGEITAAGVSKMDETSYATLESGLRMLLLDNRWPLDDAVLAGHWYIKDAIESGRAADLSNAPGGDDPALELVMHAIAKREPMLGLYRYIMASVVTQIESRRKDRFSPAVWRDDMTRFLRLLMNRGRIVFPRSGFSVVAPEVWNVKWPRRDKPDLTPLRRYLASHLNFKFLLAAPDIEYAYHLLIGAYAAVKYYSRALAASEGREVISAEDLRRGVEIVEYNLLLHRPMKGQSMQKRLIRGWFRKFLFHPAYPCSMALL